MVWYPAIQWHCADLNVKFNRLVDANFTHCANDSSIGSTTSVCEDLIPTTTPAVIYPADPRLELEVTSRTDSSVTVKWTVTEELDVFKQAVTHQRLDSNVKTRLQLAATQRQHVVTGLRPETTYKVCVEQLELTTGNGTSVVDPIVSCCPATTSFSSGSSSAIELIIGSGVGGGLAAVIILSVAVYCCCASRRRRKRPESSAPKPTVQTKRFRKMGTVATSPAGEQRTSNPYNATQGDVDRAIAETVERMDPQSIEVLTNLLRSASAGSLDHIGGASYYPSPPPGSGGYLPHGAQGRPTSSDRHFYEDLPDDTYDQIPTDDFV